MQQFVTSRKNPQLQMIRKLIKSRSERRKLGLYVADGTKLLEEALKMGADAAGAIPHFEFSRKRAGYCGYWGM